jgi:tetratricopeptide (TPR) repeat protein
VRLFALAVVLLAASCSRNLRSADAEAWLELTSEHFLLRTDLPAEDARKAIGDLELARNALLAASWNRQTLTSVRVNIVLLGNERERKEFLRERILGITTYDLFGEPLILADGADVLSSQVIKHELTHSLVNQLLITDVGWVHEGLACLLEALEIDRATGEAFRGRPSSDRRRWVYETVRVSTKNGMIAMVPPRGRVVMQWSVDILGRSRRIDEYEFQSFSWSLMQYLSDARPDDLDQFLGRLARGEPMWPAFNASFPGLDDASLNEAVYDYLSKSRGNKQRFKVPPWNGQITLQKIPAGEANALRASLFYDLQRDAPGNTQAKFDDALAAAKAVDPGNPIALAFTPHADFKLAVEKHPDDWRAWVLLYDQDEKANASAIRKALELSPGNPAVLTRLARLEQENGHGKEAIALAERARAISPRSSVLATLAKIYDDNGRCADAVVEEERAIERLSDYATEELQRLHREQLRDISDHCGKRDTLGSDTRTVEAEPVLKKCRQPLFVPEAARKVNAQFTIREDGSVTAVAISGAHDAEHSAMLRQFLESCTFEPVLVDGKPRRVQLKIKIDDLLH